MVPPMYLYRSMKTGDLGREHPAVDHTQWIAIVGSWEALSPSLWGAGEIWAFVDESHCKNLGVQADEKIWIVEYTTSTISWMEWKGLSYFTETGSYISVCLFVFYLTEF